MLARGEGGRIRGASWLGRQLRTDKTVGENAHGGDFLREKSREKLVGDCMGGGQQGDIGPINMQTAPCNL